MGSMDAHHVGSDDGVGSGSRSRARATSMSGLERAYAADAADDDPAPISLLLVQEIPLVKLNSAQNLASFVTSLGATMEEEGALDRREMSPLQRRAAATRRRIEAARTETAHPKPRRMFASPNAPPPSSPGNSPLTVLEDRRNGSPYNVGRTAVYGSGSSDSSFLATPSGINTRARMEIRQRARKIQLCTPMSAQWFRCGEHLKHLAEAATLEERAESETRILSSSESVSTSGSDGNVPGSSPLSPAMLAKIRSGHQSWPSHEKSDDKSNSLWDVDDQHVARGILEEGKLNALLRLLAAHRQLLRQKRSESQNHTWDDFIDETCVATSLTRRELLYKVKRWEVNAGEFILIIVLAIRMIDVVFCSQGSCSNARCAVSLF